MNDVAFSHLAHYCLKFDFPPIIKQSFFSSMIIYLRRDQFLEEKLVYIGNEESRNFSFRTCPRLLHKYIYCHKNSIVIMNSRIFLLRIAISYIHINVRFN